MQQAGPDPTLRQEGEEFDVDPGERPGSQTEQEVRQEPVDGALPGSGAEEAIAKRLEELKTKLDAIPSEANGTLVKEKVTRPGPPETTVERQLVVETITSWEDIPRAIARLADPNLRDSEGKSLVRLSLPEKDGEKDVDPATRMEMIDFLRSLQKKIEGASMMEVVSAVSQKLGEKLPAEEGKLSATAVMDLYKEKFEALNSDPRTLKVREIHDFRGTGAGSAKLIDDKKPAVAEEYVKNLTEATQSGREVYFRVNDTQAEAVADQLTRLLKAIEKRDGNTESSGKIEGDVVRILYHGKQKDDAQELTLAQLRKVVEELKADRDKSLAEAPEESEADKLKAKRDQDKLAHDEALGRLRTAATEAEPTDLVALKTQQTAIEELEERGRKAKKLQEEFDADAGNVAALEAKQRLERLKEARAGLQPEDQNLADGYQQRQRDHEAALARIGAPTADSLNEAQSKLADLGGAQKLRELEAEHELKKEQAAVVSPDLADLRARKDELDQMRERARQADELEKTFAESPENTQALEAKKRIEAARLAGEQVLETDEAAASAFDQRKSAYDRQMAAIGAPTQDDIDAAAGRLDSAKLRSLEDAYAQAQLDAQKEDPRIAALRTKQAEVEQMLAATQQARALEEQFAQAPDNVAAREAAERLKRVKDAEVGVLPTDADAAASYDDRQRKHQDALEAIKPPSPDDIRAAREALDRLGGADKLRELKEGWEARKRQAQEEIARLEEARQLAARAEEQAIREAEQRDLARRAKTLKKVETFDFGAS